MESLPGSQRQGQDLQASTPPPFPNQQREEALHHACEHEYMLYYCSCERCMNKCATSIANQLAVSGKLKGPDIAGIPMDRDNSGASK